MKINLKSMLFTALLGAVAISASAGSKTYYSKVTVTAETGRGLVYVSDKEGEPAESAYKQTDTQTFSKADNADIPVYIYARPLIEGESFKYWTDAAGKIVNGPLVTTKGADDKNNPSAYSYTAVFGAPSAVNITSSDLALGTVTINNPDNKIGDSVTVTATLTEPWAGGMGTKKWSKSHTFDGWYDEDGNLVSKDAKYTFKIEQPVSLTARFSWRQFVTGPGYYRVRYSYNQQFWLLSGSYDPTPGMFTNHDSRKINGVLDLSKINDFSNPACVMKLDAETFKPLDSYKEESVVAENITLESQGVSTSAILSKYKIKLQTCHNVGFYKFLCNSYQIAASEHNYGSESNPNLGYLYVNSDQTGKSASDPDSYFELEPLDEEHIDEFYFGAEPAEEMTFDGGYWTSMYTSFPYECYAPDGVEAYYISEIHTATGSNLALLKKIEDGKVPANTAVLLKCKGLTAKENRLLPLMEDVPALEKNLLNGEFQLNQSKDNPNLKDFDENSMRVFGLNADGEPGFFKLAAGTKLAANRAWLDISGLSDAPIAKIIIRTETSGIEDIVSGIDESKKGIFDIRGNRVTNPVKGEIYIIDGVKKVYDR